MPDEAPTRTSSTSAAPTTPPARPTPSSSSKAWVAWAKANDAVILFDAAYECFVSEPGLARSIYEVEGAKEVAIEVCSFSKIAGFTGTRCGYTVVPQALVGGKLNKMWLRRQTTKFNGVAYVVQRGCRGRLYRRGHEGDPAEPRLLPRQRSRHCGSAGRGRCLVLRRQEQPLHLAALPQQDGQLGVFDWLLENAHVVGTPGEGFGPCGKGYFRLTAFGDAERTKEAAARIKKRWLHCKTAGGFTP